MKTAALIAIHLIFAAILVSAACANSNPNDKLQGTWHTTDKSAQLKITAKKFIMDSDPAEDYIRKGDTILTSFNGNQPYTRFVIQKLDDRELKLLYPDSVSIDFVR